MKKHLLFIAIGVLIANMAFPQGNGSHKPKDLQVLKFESIPETKKFMKQMSKDLGVKCKFCHNLDDFSLETDHKKIGRHMIKMTMNINEKYFNWDKARNVTCWTCHQGQKEPPEKK